LFRNTANLNKRFPVNRKGRQLGLDRDITRRDFLNGTSIAVGGSLLATPLAQAMAELGLPRS
jgi:hypothetical protein